MGSEVSAGRDRDRARDRDVDPARCDCGFTSTVQVPGPSPASVTASSSDLDTGPRLTFRSANESDTGSVKSFGSFAATHVRQPQPAGMTGASTVRAVSAQADARRGDEGGLHLPRRPAGMPLEPERGRARHVGRGHARSVEDGTSMAAPHVAGAAALLLQHHPGWTAGQVKSALVSTAATAWADTARTVEAPVLTAGSGLINVVAANDPKLFTDPVSLSYADLNVTSGPVSKSLLLAVADAGDGAGTWTVEVKPQANPSGVQIIVPGTLTIAPGGDLQVPVTARAAADAGLGEAYGFLLLRRGDVVRKVAYAMLVTRPGLAQAPILQLGLAQTGDTRKGVSHASAYRYPAAAFGPAANYVGTPVNEDGAEAPLPVRWEKRAGCQRRRRRDLLHARLSSSFPGCSARLTRTTSRDTQALRSTSTT